MIYQYKIQIKNITKPPVWRQLLIPDTFSFHKLHEVIQISFGWENCHLYMFNPKGYGSKPVIAIPSPEDWDKPDKNAKSTKLNQVFTSEKQSFTYIYDFGDDWVHHIVLEKILSDEIKYPVCLAGKGTCPPEDCGGSWGYESLKAILDDPKHQEYLEMKEWLGLEDNEDWDPNIFDINEINEVLKKYK